MGSTKSAGFWVPSTPSSCRVRSKIAVPLPLSSQPIKGSANGGETGISGRSITRSSSSTTVKQPTEAGGTFFTTLAYTIWLKGTVLV